MRPATTEPATTPRRPSWWISRDQVLEEALQLLHRAVRGGQERAGVVRAGLEPLDVVELGDQLAAEALDPALDRDGVAGLEAKAEAVDLAKDARGQRAACGRAARARGRPSRSAPSGGPCGRRRTRPPSADRAAGRRPEWATRRVRARERLPRLGSRLDCRERARTARAARRAGVAGSLGRVDHVIWEGDPPELRSPVLVCAFAGWNDAASAASTALGSDRRRPRVRRSSPASTPRSSTTSR